MAGNYLKYKEYYARKRQEKREQLFKEIAEKHGGDDWKPIPSFDGYRVSKRGEIINKYGKPLKPCRLKKSGHLHVMLSRKDAPAQHMYVHKAVWLAFKGEIKEGMQICHIDGNTENNNLENLVEMTCSQNLKKNSTKSKRFDNKFIQQLAFAKTEE